MNTVNNIYRAAKDELEAIVREALAAAMAKGDLPEVEIGKISVEEVEATKLVANGLGVAKGLAVLSQLINNEGKVIAVVNGKLDYPILLEIINDVTVGYLLLLAAIEHYRNGNDNRRNKQKVKEDRLYRTFFHV